ncbi:MAG TPA: hypothetical protein VGF82_24170 [Terracidiphilus sp.]
MAAAHQFETSSTTWGLDQLARTAQGKALLERHLVEVTKGAAFKGSQRSAQFLEYVVQQSASGRPEMLKERLIGIKLFGRIPTYDTGEDAIVRVTATDVRRRLSQHYSNTGRSSEFRINLPPGKYVPEIVQTPATITLPLLWTGDSISSPEAMAPATPSASSDVTTAAAASPLSVGRTWLLASACMMAVGLASLGFAWWLMGHLRHPVPAPQHAMAPWSSLFNGSGPVLIVPSDPNVEETQRIAHAGITLSEYANQHYLPPNVDHLPAMEVDFMKNILRGNKISSVDGSIIAGLVGLMAPGHFKPEVKAARDIRPEDLETNENLILLGSPRSNPWAAMYDPLLDFRFVFDDVTQRELVRDARPVSGEKAEYIPTAGGFDTGKSYATISVFQMSGHVGKVLLIAGANGEGTEAAGALVTDPSRWESALQSCHLTPGGPQSVQLLLQLGMMGGSANLVSVVSCHLLTASPAHN